MDNTEEINKNNKLAVVNIKNQSQVHMAPKLKGRLSHGLFFDPRRLYLDRRLRQARIVRDLEKHLLAVFNEPYPAGVLLIVQRCAFKALRCKSFEIYVLRQKECGCPPDSSDDKYIKFANSLTKDIELLWRMAQETPKITLKTLQEYVAEAHAAGEIIEQKKG